MKYTSSGVTESGVQKLPPDHPAAVFAYWVRPGNWPLCRPMKRCSLLEALQDIFQPVQGSLVFIIGHFAKVEDFPLYGW